MVYRVGAAALVVAIATLNFGARAHACDPRISGACPGAPITHPGTLVEGGGDQSTEPARATRRSARAKRWRHRSRGARRSRTAAASRRATPAKAATEAAGSKSEIAATKPASPTTWPDVALRRIAPPDGGPSENTGSFVAVRADALAAATKTRSVPAPVRPVAAPAVLLPNVIPGARFDASLLAPPTAPVRAGFVSAKATGDGQAVNQEQPATKVQTVSYAAPASGQTVQSASDPPAVSSMTTLRAMFLAMVGLLAVGTAVRMVV
jgi:hypothetical protein